MAGKDSKKRANVPGDAAWDGVKPLPPPVVVDGFFVYEEGNVIEGVITGEGETQFGPYYAVKASKPTRISRDKEYVDAPAGTIVGLSDRAALRGVGEYVAKGPTAIRVVVLGKVGKAWDLDVRCREAF